MLQRINNNEEIIQNNLITSELIEHTGYFGNEYYDFKLSQEDTLRFSSTLHLIGNFQELVNLVINTNSNFDSTGYLDEKIETVYHRLKRGKDYEKILLSPRRTIIEAIESIEYFSEGDVKGSEDRVLLGEMIEAFSDILFSYLQEHEEYSKHLKWIYLGL